MTGGFACGRSKSIVRASRKSISHILNINNSHCLDVTGAECAACKYSKQEKENPTGRVLLKYTLNNHLQFSCISNRVLNH